VHWQPPSTCARPHVFGKTSAQRFSRATHAARSKSAQLADGRCTRPCFRSPGSDTALGSASSSRTYMTCSHMLRPWFLLACLLRLPVAASRSLSVSLGRSVSQQPLTDASKLHSVPLSSVSVLTYRWHVLAYADALAGTSQESVLRHGADGWQNERCRHAATAAAARAAAAAHLDGADARARGRRAVRGPAVAGCA